jgi:hypothetical protein
MRLWFLGLAPLIPISGVAAAYGPLADPMYEVVAATPYPRMRLVLLRCLAVLPISLLFVLAGALSLPGGLGTSVLWLLPALALSLVTLALEGRFGATRVAAGVALCWLAAVWTAYRATGSVLPAFAPASQLIFALVAVVAAVAVFRGRLETWR